MELFIVSIVGVVVAALLFREFGGRRTSVSAVSASIAHSPKSAHWTSNYPESWMTDPAYYWLLGNIYYSQHQNQVDGDSSDWVTDPSRSYLPGNIYHQDDSSSASCSCIGSDWMTDPCCSYMPGNIYHDDHFSSSSAFSSDDTWSSSSTSSFGDSWSSSSFSNDD